MENNSPLISIIVPCYNGELFIDSCLQSITEQSFEAWECLVIDDGSTDNSYEKALKWSKKDSRIKVIKKENGGGGRFCKKFRHK